MVTLFFLLAFLLLKKQTQIMIQSTTKRISIIMITKILDELPETELVPRAASVVETAGDEVGEARSPKQGTMVAHE